MSNHHSVNQDESPSLFALIARTVTFALVILGTWYFFVTNVLQQGTTGAKILVGVFAGMITLVLLSLTFSKWSDYLAHQVLVLKQLKVSPDPVVPGREMSCTIVMTAQSDVTIEAVQATLEGYEEEQVVDEDSASDRRTKRAEYVQETVTLTSRKRQLAAGASESFEGTITIPDQFTLSGENYPAQRVSWCIRMEVELDGWPDWGQARELVLQARS